METVYLHGFATTPEVWRNQTNGEKPHLMFEDIKGTAEGLLKGIGVGEKIRIVGWSMGGMVAMLMAAMAPEKINSLVLVSTTPKFIRSDDFPHAIPLAILRRLEKKIKVEGIKVFYDLIFTDKIKTTPLPCLPAVGGGEGNGVRVFEELAELAKVDLRSLLPKINCPTLIIHGDQDEICLPGAAEYMNKEIKNSKLIILKGAGHAPMLEAPEEFKKYVG
ncbi:MAG: alpha/beta hydrolase [bacterium]